MLIIISEEKNRKRLVQFVQDHEIQAKWCQPDKLIAPNRKTDCVYLIDTLDDVAHLGQQLQVVKETYPDHSVVGCFPSMLRDDREALIECGAARIISPRSWDQTTLSQRILADYFAYFTKQPKDGLVGSAQKMLDLFEEIGAFASSSDHSLILGPTGSGKELVARALHSNSRPREPFMAINCAAISSEIIESELFGHTKGAFTGAETSRPGLFLAAGKGTVFLDEVGEMSLPLQAKLLRVLEDKMVRAVGDTKERAMEARIILATHRDLASDVEKGTFRQDLYNRINPFTLIIPPLCKRKVDIPTLARYFLNQLNHDPEASKSIQPSTEMDDLLMGYNYEVGNVRQLRGAIRYAAAFTQDGQSLNLRRLRRNLGDAAAAPETSQAGGNQIFRFNPAQETWKEIEKRFFAAYGTAAINEADGNKAAAAKMAGLSRAAFYDRLSRSKQHLEED